MIEFNLRINLNNNSNTTIKLKQKMKMKQIKIFLKKKFNIKSKFYLKYNQRILQNKEIFSSKFYKKNTEIEIIQIKNRNRACLLHSNKKVLRTVAKFFRYFLKLDVEFFDNIMNTLKYSNPLLFRFILAKKQCFVNMIFSKQKEIKADELTDDPNIKRLFKSFESVFFDKEKSFNLKNYMEKKISSENSRNNSSCCFNENISKSSNFSKNSINSNNNFSNNSNFENCAIQKCLDFNIIDNKYEFFECNFEKKVNNFVSIK